MAMIRTAIIDDEPLARSRLVRLLASLEQVDVVATGENGQQAIELVRSQPIDLLILDINMPIVNGLQAAREIVAEHAQPPAIIFCTAYDEFALQAFSAQAAAYLMKPVNVDDLRTAVETASSLTQLQVQNLLAVEQKPHIGLHQGLTIENRLLSEVLYFRAEQKHVVAGLLDGTEIVVDQTLKNLEAEYDVHFIRVHRNSLLNRAHLASFNRDQQGHADVTLVGSDMRFNVSRRHLAQVKRCFN